jgi:glucans biosynthesis protein
MRRRELFEQAFAIAATALLPSCGTAQQSARAGLRFARPEPFDFDRLRARARLFAERPHRPAPSPAPALVEALDYDAFQRIQPRDEATLWPSRAGTPPVKLFHLGRHNRHPVRVAIVENGTARELAFDPALFDYGDPALARRVPRDLGWGGLRVMHGDTRPGDWLAFSGASYFRSAGELDQYGLSARGLAIGTGLPEPEEFPRFSELYVSPADGVAEITIMALLEGPSATGAFRFRCRRDRAVIIDTDAYLYPRGPIARLGVAPLTSMFWFSETNRHDATDWRPEIHDSDGLALFTGAGERLWRPLRNPRALAVHSYRDRDPRGFGLSQRDRSFASYEDDGVFYDRRPSLWIEPAHAWGEGEVMLVEIPTDDEIFDNIVAFWKPDAPARAGEEMRFSYRMRWAATEPLPDDVARVIATRVGRAGVPGQPRPADGVKFAIDFEGGAIAGLDRESVTPVVSASRGEIVSPYALPIAGTRRWRAVFDVRADGSEVVELRCALRRNDRALTETWIYPLVPFRF